MRSPRRTTANGTLDERVYFCQNFRHDVVALLDDAGGQLETVRYSAYGVPFGLPAGDCDSDGDTDGTDVGLVQTWYAAPSYDVRGDLDLDGDVDATDVTAVGSLSGTTLGHGALSRSDVASHAGYASYRHDETIDRLCHVRYRVFHTILGHWSRRNPLGYVEGPSLVQYSRSQPLYYTDPTGLPCEPAAPSCGGGVGTFPVSGGLEPPDVERVLPGGAITIGPDPALCAEETDDYRTCVMCCDEIALRRQLGIPWHAFCFGACMDKFLNRDNDGRGPVVAPCPPGTVPQCPATKPVWPGGDPKLNDGWCEDTWGGGHCGLDCYRSYGTGTRSGQQCCYNGDGSLNTDPACMGTIDLCGNAMGEDGHSGACTWSASKTLCHFFADYLPYSNDPEWYDQVQCCMRAGGIPSGTSDGRCVSDNEVLGAFGLCAEAVNNAPDFDFCSLN